MTISSTNYTDMSYTLEITAGVTPANPVFQMLPTTGGTPEGNLSTAVSEVIRSDRQTDDLIVVDSEVGGSIDYELSYIPYKPLIRSLLQSTFAAATIATSSANVTFAAAVGQSQTITDVAGTAFSAVVVGQFIRVKNAVNATNNGIFKVLTKTSGSVISVKNPAGVSATTDAVDFDALVYRNGSSTPDSYTFMKRVMGVAQPAYFYYRGIQISEMSFNFETGAILKGSFNTVGLSETVTITAIPGQSILPVPNYDLMNSVTSITSIDIGGLAATTKFSNLNLTVNNNINSAKQIGVLGSAALTSFTLDVTGDISVYFEDIAAYTAFKNSTSFDLAFVLQDASGNTMVISLPKVKFETLSTPVSGKDSFLMLDGTIRALKDTATDHTIQVCFFDGP